MDTWWKIAGLGAWQNDGPREKMYSDKKVAIFIYWVISKKTHGFETFYFRHPVLETCSKPHPILKLVVYKQYLLS